MFKKYLGQYKRIRRSLIPNFFMQFKIKVNAGISEEAAAEIMDEINFFRKPVSLKV